MHAAPAAGLVTSPATVSRLPGSYEGPAPASRRVDNAPATAHATAIHRGTCAPPSCRPLQPKKDRSRGVRHTHLLLGDLREAAAVSTRARPSQMATTRRA